VRSPSKPQREQSKLPKKDVPEFKANAKEIGDESLDETTKDKQSIIASICEENVEPSFRSILGLQGAREPQQILNKLSQPLIEAVSKNRVLGQNIYIDHVIADLQSTPEHNRKTLISGYGIEDTVH